MVTAMLLWIRTLPHTRARRMAPGLAWLALAGCTPRRHVPVRAAVNDVCPQPFGPPCGAAAPRPRNLGSQTQKVDTPRGPSPAQHGNPLLCHPPRPCAQGPHLRVAHAAGHARQPRGAGPRESGVLQGGTQAAVQGQSVRAATAGARVLGGGGSGGGGGGIEVGEAELVKPPPVAIRSSRLNV